MSEDIKIVHLRNQEIDYAKWDRCIQHAQNGNLYSKSWFLDVVNPNWEAFVSGDYDYVMPLPVIKKFGVRLLIQPLHCQQLGIFPVPEPDIQLSFAENLLNAFRILRYQLNAQMQIDSFGNFQKQKKENFLLSLDKPMKVIAEGFTKHAKRNIKVADKKGVTVVKGLQPAEFFSVKSHADKRKVSRKSFRILQTLMAQTLPKGTGIIYAAYSKTNNLCAAAFIVFDQNRAYYLNAFSTEEGRENRAMYSIVNEFIKEFAGTGILIDFEGSMIKGVARFYKGFGAVAENYFYVHANRFPFIGKIF